MALQFKIIENFPDRWMNRQREDEKVNINHYSHIFALCSAVLLFLHLSQYIRLWGSGFTMAAQIRWQVHALPVHICTRATQAHRVGILVAEIAPLQAPLHFVIPLWHFTRLQAADPPISYKTYSNLTSLWTAYHLQSAVCLQANSKLFPSFSFITCQRYFGLHPWYFKIMTLSSTEKPFYCRQMKFSWLCSYNYSLN